MKNNLIGLTIGAAVAIIVLASVLVPVTSDAEEALQADERYNTTYNHRMSLVDSATISYDHTTKIVSITSERGSYTYDVTSDPSLTVCFFHSDHSWIEMDRYNESAGSPVMSFISGTSNFGVNTEDWELDLENDVATFVHGASHIEIDAGESAYNYIYDPNGDYIYATSARIGQVNISDDADNLVIKMGGWWSNSINTVEFTKSDLENGVAATLSTTTNPAVISNVHLFLNATSHGDRTYSLPSSGQIRDDVTQETSNITGLGVITPYKYTAYVANGESAIIHAIPLLVIVAVIVGVASVGLRSRD